MLSDFERWWDSYFSQIEIAKHGIDQSPANAQPIHSAPNRAFPKARKFQKKKFEEILLEGTIELAQTD